MNSATFNDTKRMWLVAGQESHCQLYNIHAKVVVVANGEIPKGFPTREELRQRRRSKEKKETPAKRENVEEIKSDEFKAKHKKLQLVITPADSIQTDFK